MENAPDLVQFCRDEYSRLVGSLGLFCGDVDLAEELANEALMRACRDWNKVRNLASPTAWVHAVGMNLARSHFRRKAAERRATERLQSRSVASPEATEQSDAITIRSAVAGLPARQKKALVLRYYVDLRIDEIAEAMDCSPSTVKSLVRSALRSLRDKEGFAHLEEVGDAV
ncbi:MAG: sigma-70 family RNA polymerase sigma factor [Actinobacteria bacterium]|nr:sigma-70 family RNA polymerase sigma factor [Actinomycetota bacterium]